MEKSEEDLGEFDEWMNNLDGITDSISMILIIWETMRRHKLEVFLLFCKSKEVEHEINYLNNNGNETEKQKQREMGLEIIRLLTFRKKILQ